MIPPPGQDTRSGDWVDVPSVTTVGTDIGTVESSGYGFWPPDDDCPVCGARPGNSRHRLTLCFSCAELQRWVPRRMRNNIAALRDALAQLETTLRRARSYFHPPSRVWRQITPPLSLPQQKPTLHPRFHRPQVRLAAPPPRRKTRAIRASHVPGHRREGGRRRAV